VGPADERCFCPIHEKNAFLMWVLIVEEEEKRRRVKRSGKREGKGTKVGEPNGVRGERIIVAEHE
jgi:hypothetical protein